jgi:hypothetical protein
MGLFRCRAEGLATRHPKIQSVTRLNSYVMGKGFATRRYPQKEILGATELRCDVEGCAIRLWLGRTTVNERRHKK